MRRLVLFLVCLLLTPLVHGAVMETSVVEGTKNDGNVYHDFTYASVLVSPENAFSTDGVFKQKVHFKNTHSVALHVWFDSYFNENLSTISFREEKVSKKNYSATNQKWGGVEHYHTQESILVQPGQNISFDVVYKVPLVKEGHVGKWNARFWASASDDWRCVQSETCLYDITIDPTYTISQTTSSTLYNHGVRAGLDFYTTTPQVIGQTFIINSSGNGTSVNITSLNLSLDRINAGAGTCGINITGVVNASVNAPVPNATQYGNTSFQGTLLSTSAVIYQFSFPTPAIVKDNETYALILACSDGSMNARAYGVNSNAYANGKHTAKSAGSGTWSTVLTAGDDLFFVITYDEAAPVVPPTAPGLEANMTYTNPVIETSANNFFVNVSWVVGSNVSNVTGANLTYNNTLYVSTVASAGANWTRFNVSSRTAPLVYYNNTNISFSWTYNVLYNDSSNYPNGTSTLTQQVYWGIYSTGVQHVGNITETSTNKYNITFQNDITNNYCNNGEQPTWTYLSKWNETVHASTGCVSSCSSVCLFPAPSTPTQQFSFTTPFISSQNASFNLSPQVNITFDGVTMYRNASVSNTGQVQQTINQMILTTCSSVSGVRFANYSIRDQDNNALIGNADLSTSWDIWLTTASNNRSYDLGFTTNSSPQLCLFPTNETFNVVGTLTASATGYASRITSTGGILISNNSFAQNLFLINSSSATAIIFNVLNENDAPIQGLTLTIEKFVAPSNYTVIATGTTDFNGQRSFNLNTADQYRVNVTSGSDLLNLTDGSPASVGPFQIISTTITLRVNTGILTGITPLVNNQLFLFNHTFNGTHIVYEWDDLGNVSSSTRIIISSVNGSNITIALDGTNTNSTGTYSLQISTAPINVLPKLVYTSSVYITSTTDGQTYLIDTLTVDTRTASILGTDGLILAWVVWMTLGLMMSWQPMISLLMLLVAVIATGMAGFYLMSALTVVGMAFVIIIHMIMQSKL